MLMTCNCRNVKFNDVMYASRTDVKINLSQTGVQYPYCKNCGDWLTTTQKEKHDSEKVEKWEERKRSELNMIRKTYARISYGKDKTSTSCMNCGTIIKSPMSYCPVCKSTQLKSVKAE